jgi:pyruvate/2-oxoglutarate dehydrogenase complex dihydrolipoamide dehydrogenase (E3) component
VATEQYDCLILGSGQAGSPLATALAQAGRKTAIVERVHVGGTCINEGCTPTKTMVASARVAYLARRGTNYGVDVGEVTVDMRRVRQRKREIVDSFRGSSERRLEDKPNLDLIYGEARFTGPKTVQIMLPSGEKRELTAETIFINTGERPADPNVPGLDPARALNSSSIMELDAAPSHLLVIGGGYVGLEFAQMFRRFGSQVTIIQRGRQRLGREDSDVAEAVAQILAKDGIEILLNSAPTSATSEAESVTLHVKTPDGERDLTGSHVLAAAGRVPNTEALNLAAAGVATNERGYIQVNARLETSAPGIYALGDVKGPPAFTHISYDDFRIIRTNLLESGSATTTDRLVPYTVFIDPQLGRVGLSEEEARRQGRNIKVAKMPMSWVARADEVDETRGFMKAIVDAETRQILGCAILGIEGGELMAMVEIAMLGHLPYTVLRDAIFAHPTLAESLNNLFTSLDE